MYSLHKFSCPSASEVRGGRVAELRFAEWDGAFKLLGFERQTFHDLVYSSRLLFDLTCDVFGLNVPLGYGARMAAFSPDVAGLCPNRAFDL